MIESIQRFIQDACLSVLGLIGGVCILYWISVTARRFFARSKAIGLAALLTLAAVAAVILGGGKSEGEPLAKFPPAPQTQLVPLSPDVGLTNHVHSLVVQSPRASATMPFRAAKWNVRGAWNDSFRYAFADGWEFPFGTGHLDRVEVCSQGRVIPRYGSTDVIADVGVPLQIVNPITSFGCGPTDRNSCIFSWTNAVVGRVLHENIASAETINASIELFRNGDVAITTNGITELIPRVLPFPHDGFGQDDDWVSGNFTNAAEILSIGYPQWVDAQVGENLTNGLYKFTVTIPEVPPETVQLVVGDYSVAVTNAGEYVFLLEKGIRHQLHLFPYLDEVEYSCSDEILEGDAPLRSGAPPTGGTSGNSPYIVNITAMVDSGNGVELVVPTRSGDGHVLCWPWLSIAPSSVTTAELPVTFVACIFDIPFDANPSVVWKRGEEVVGTGETFVLTGMEDGDLGAVDVFATYRDVTLHGVIMIARHARASNILLGGNGVIFVEDSYTNAPGEVVFENSTTTGLHLAWALAEAGQLKLDADCAQGVAVYEDLGDGIELPVPLAWTWDADCDAVGSRDFLVYCTDMSNTGTIGTFTFSFTPEDGGMPLTNTLSLQVIKIKVEAEADWPSNKVRHVFGPKERFTITTTPHVSLHAESNSYVTVSNDETTVIAPDRAGPFSVAAFLGTTTNNLLFNCIAPTEIKGSNPRDLNNYELVHHDVPQFNVGDVGVAMHIDTWLEPLFVSFQNVSIYEGYAPPINRNGWYQDTNAFSIAWLEHGDAAGAFSNYAEVSSTGNLIDGGDIVAALMIPTNTYYNGSYQLSIPAYWFAKDGSVTNHFANNVLTIQVYSNGNMRVSKNGVTWERCLDGTSHKIEE